MNPIENFRDIRNREIMAGGKPLYCIMGDHDFARMCGAVGIVFETPILSEDEFLFEGIRIRRSRSNKTGIMVG